jgi:ATP-binding protein involved in chromosome partitioning
MSDAIKSAVERALGSITNPRHGRDVVAAAMVRDITVDAAGAVTFTFVLTREDPGSLARQARKAVEGVAGVTAVKMNVVDSAEATGRPSGASAPPHRAAPAPAPPAPPTADEIPALGKVLAISSGKGGVGKSTVSANLAAALVRDGHRVGLMDADIYGPNIPRMFGVNAKPEVQGGKIQPLEAHGVKLMSLGFIVERDAPAIWRGPIIMKIVTQFLRDVAWGELDYFLVDLPPGTGDAQLSLTQLVRLHGAIIVTTPQEMAVGDSLRGAKMFERVGVGVIGIVENMSYFVCPHCREHSEVFLAGGGSRLAAELGVPLLGQIPLQAGMAELADRGEPIVVSQPDSPAGTALRDLARTVVTRTAGLSPAVPITAHR